MALGSTIDESKLDLAYKYPFLRDAKELVTRLNPGFETKFLEQGRMRLEEALSEKRIGFQKANLRDLKYAYLMSYIYARMLVSALNSRSAMLQYIDAESRRAAEALKSEDHAVLMKIAEELNSGVSCDNSSFSVRFERYLEYAPASKRFALPMQELGNGIVTMDRSITIGILRRIIKKEIAKNLPIPKKELSKEVFECSKKVKLPEVKISAPNPNLEKRYAWIEKLLATPIPDIRHRAVNLILAPYLITIRKMDEAEAVKVIINYIERCKEIEPSTKVNESYIRYQCRYAKNKGMRPLTLENAKELLGSMVNIEELERA
jgi:hypothetical protein